MPETTETVVRKPTPSKHPRRAPGTMKIADLFPPQGQWTESDYFALPETNRIVELSDGKVVIPDMPTTSHQYAVVEFCAHLRAFVREHNLGHVLVAPLPVRLWHGKIREPDVVFLSREHEDRRGEEFWGVPDLVTEVISPRTPHSSGTESTDRNKKFQEYAEAGVQEYWLVDPAQRVIEVYSLREGAYHSVGRWVWGETARSDLLPGFEIPVSAIISS